MIVNKSPTVIREVNGMMTVITGKMSELKKVKVYVHITKDEIGKSISLGAENGKQAILITVPMEPLEDLL